MELLNLIRLELSILGIKTFRANVGKVKIADGRFFETGLPKGFSDIFGVLEGGRALFIEVKFGKNKASPEQLNFIDQMKKQGAVAGIVYSVKEATELCNLKK